MTYTYKLARRLAISRPLQMVAVTLILAACDGETTGPDSTTTSEIANTYGLRVIPGAVTIETGQPIRFRGETSDGSVVFKAGLTWESSGGSIGADGTFTASEPGTYKVVGRERGRLRPDTSIVIVVPPQPNLKRIRISPDSATVPAGESQLFTAAGRLTDGRKVDIGVTWSATGGTIDAGGVYKAGSSSGRFHVIATRGELADTAVVEVTQQPAPAPEPEPEPEPEPPTLARVVLRPASVTLITNTTKQFSAFGRTAAGDSIVIPVEFTATGGTVSSTGVYTAGPASGTYRVIASAQGLADTSVVTLTPPPAPGGTVGLPFGPSQQLGRAGGVAAPFTMTSDAYTAGTIIDRIRTARANGYRLLLNLTGGSHDNYMSTIDGVYKFDIAKWRAKMDTYNTSAIKEAVAEAVRDGVIVGNLVMDEPHVSGGVVGGNGDGNTWGPKGTMTKVIVDGMCGYVKEMFPTMAVGVFHQHNTFEPENSYTICDFNVNQYNYRRGDVTTFRDEGLAMARRDGHEVMFSLNILNGGVQDTDGNWDCAGPGQGGRGTFEPNCRMTPDQVRDWGILLGTAGCGLFMWRYDADFVSNAANQRAFQDLAARMASAPSKSCHRP